MFPYLVPTALPAPLQDENTVRLVLKAIKSMDADDPAIFVQWDTRGFNDTATANCRNGVAGQTLLNLIGYITGSGGANF